jgi:hypothetical protein
MNAIPLLAAAALAGCYMTGRVPVQAMRGLAGGFDGPRMVDGQPLEPGTMIRAELTDGTETRWFQAGHLRVSDEGLMTTDPPSTGPGARSATGVRWSEARAFQLRSLSPELSALSIPMFPYVLLIGSLDKHAFDRVLSPTDGEGEGAPPLRLWSEAPTRPLFTFGARRRAVVQALAVADVQGTYRGDFATGLAIGGRFQNVWEFSFVARPLSIAGVEAGGGRANVMAYGGSMGMHIDGDADARFALYLGIEVIGTSKPGEIVSGQLKWGPRFGLRHGLFVTVSPLNYMKVDVAATPDRPAWTLGRVVTTVELGGTL